MGDVVHRRHFEIGGYFGLFPKIKYILFAFNETVNDAFDIHLRHIIYCKHVNKRHYAIYPKFAAILNFFAILVKLLIWNAYHTENVSYYTYWYDHNYGQFARFYGTDQPCGP